MERKAREKNPANFGKGYARKCVCEVDGQVPCMSTEKLLAFTKRHKISGKGKRNMNPKKYPFGLEDDWRVPQCCAGGIWRHWRLPARRYPAEVPGSRLHEERVPFWTLLGRLNKNRCTSWSRNLRDLVKKPRIETSKVISFTNCRISHRTFSFSRLKSLAVFIHVLKKAVHG